MLRGIAVVVLLAMIAAPVPRIWCGLTCHDTTSARPAAATPADPAPGDHCGRLAEASSAAFHWQGRAHDHCAHETATPSSLRPKSESRLALDAGTSDESSLAGTRAHAPLQTARRVDKHTPPDVRRVTTRSLRI